MNSGVYIITNHIDKKYYIGESTNWRKRASQHKSNLKAGIHSNLHLQRAVIKYGIENFTFELLEECEDKYLKSQENYWCNMLDVHNDDHGYNIDSCDPTGTCRKKSVKTKELIGLKAKERGIAGEKNPFYGRKHSEETRKKMSEFQKGRKKKPWSPERRLKQLNKTKSI